MADEAGAELPKREQIFLDAISIVEEIEDKVVLLFETLESEWQPAEAELGDYASNAINDVHRLLFNFLRRLNSVHRYLASAYESLPAYDPPET